jgi:hypothetical protein
MTNEQHESVVKHMVEDWVARAGAVEYDRLALKIGLSPSEIEREFKDYKADETAPRETSRPAVSLYEGDHVLRDRSVWIDEPSTGAIIYIVVHPCSDDSQLMIQVFNNEEDVELDEPAQTLHWYEPSTEE